MTREKSLYRRALEYVDKSASDMDRWYQFCNAIDRIVNKK